MRSEILEALQSVAACVASRCPLLFWHHFKVTVPSDWAYRFGFSMFRLPSNNETPDGPGVPCVGKGTNGSVGSHLVYGEQLLSVLESCSYLTDTAVKGITRTPELSSLCASKVRWPWHVMAKRLWGATSQGFTVLFWKVDCAPGGPRGLIWKMGLAKLAQRKTYCLCGL